MTPKQLARVAAGLHDLASNAETNGDFATAAHLLESEALVHRAAGALELARLTSERALRVARRRIARLLGVRT